MRLRLVNQVLCPIAQMYRSMKNDENGQSGMFTSLLNLLLSSWQFGSRGWSHVNLCESLFWAYFFESSHYCQNDVVISLCLEKPPSPWNVVVSATDLYSKNFWGTASITYDTHILQLNAVYTLNCLKFTGCSYGLSLRNLSSFSNRGDITTAWQYFREVQWRGVLHWRKLN